MSYLQQAREVFETEAMAVRALSDQLDAHFDRAIDLMLACKGRVVVCGMGKSGIIGKKIAATLASTGTPSFFLHPAEAFHGDLGMLKHHDVLLSISNSGETDEILRLIPSILRIGVKHVTIVGNTTSTLARHAEAVLNISISREACPLQLAPMASTTAALAMGDALAAVLMTARGFKEDNFALFHPGGSLGRKLLTKVGDEMKTASLPTCAPDASLQTLIMQMTEGKMGLVAVCDAGNMLAGLITDGDLRRALGNYAPTEFFALTARDLMTENPVTISPDARAAAADALMHARKITALLVAKEGHLVGVYHRIG